VAIGPEFVASPGKRLLGALIDGMIFLLVGLPAFAAGAEGTAFALTWLALVAVYEVVLIATRGQTLGKLTAGTRVVDHSGERLPAWSQAVARWLVPSVPAIIGVFVVVDLVDVLGGVWTALVYLPILGPPLRQGWHDRAAGTVVVDARSWGFRSGAE
jgi:uncharacterized RDD family membrane protein YckC